MDEGLKAEADGLGIKVDSRWSDATLRRKVEEARTARGNDGFEVFPATETVEVKIAQPDEAQWTDTAPTAERLFPVKLTKHYKPATSTYRVLEEVPPPFPGAIFPDKLWAGTVVELPRDEAVRLIENVATTREVIRDAQGHPLRDADGRPQIRVNRTPFPLASRADAIPL